MLEATGGLRAALDLASFDGSYAEAFTCYFLVLTVGSSTYSYVESEARP